MFCFLWRLLPDLAHLTWSTQNYAAYWQSQHLCGWATLLNGLCNDCVKAERTLVVLTVLYRLFVSHHCAWQILCSEQVNSISVLIPWKMARSELGRITDLRPEGITLGELRKLNCKRALQTDCIEFSSKTNRARSSTRKGSVTFLESWYGVYNETAVSEFIPDRCFEDCRWGFVVAPHHRFWRICMCYPWIPLVNFFGSHQLPGLEGARTELTRVCC